MQREYVPIGDCTLDVLRQGDGPPIVVYHGEYGTIFARKFLDQLAISHEVIVPHHPGWAGSTRPPHVKTIRDLALLQQEFLQHLGQAIPVVGLSLGGWVAAEVAATWPSSTPALVLVSPTGIKVGGREDRDFVDIYVTDPDQRRSLFSSVGVPEADPLLLDGDLYLEMAKAEEAVARFCWTPYMHDPGLRYRLRRVDCPALVMSGSADELVRNPTYFKEYTKLLGDRAVHHVVEGAGHCIEEDMPHVVVGAVNQFTAAGAEAPSVSQL
jgi:pimeloyl-ACP methyl ester carboxylesterase